jgi:hypothetical protein
LPDRVSAHGDTRSLYTIAVPPNATTRVVLTLGCTGIAAGQAVTGQVWIG